MSGMWQRQYKGGLGVVPLAQEDLWKLSSDKREVFFLFIAIYCLISTHDLL